MKKLLIFLLALAGSLAVAEIMVRILFPIDAHYWLVINRAHKAEIIKESNSLGFRDFEHSPDKPKDRKRILVVGDSFAAGWGVRFNEMFARRLEKLLPGTEVILIAKPGWNAWEEIQAVERIGLKFHPDLIIMEYYLNDPLLKRDALRVRKRVLYKQPRGFWRTLFLKSMLFRLFWKVTHDPQATRAYIWYINMLHSPDYAGWEKTVEAYSRLRELCSQRHIPVIVILFPTLAFPFSHYPFVHVHHRIKRLMETEHFIFIDLLDYLRGFNNRELIVEPHDLHPNAKVHAIAAKVLKQTIKEHHLL